MRNELEKLLEFKDGKLMIEGYDLVELADMYKLSVPVFMYLLQMYLCTEYGKANFKLNNDIIITNVKEKRYLAPFDLKYEESYIYKGEVLVPSNRYEEIKEKTFDFAYTKCSNKVNPLKDKTKIDDLNREEFYSILDDSCLFNDYFSAIYPGIHNNWKIKISPIPIRYNDINKEKEERYSLIKK